MVFKFLKENDKRKWFGRVECVEWVCCIWLCGFRLLGECVFYFDVTL